MADTWTPIDDPTAFQDDAVFEIDKATKSIQVLVEQPIVAGENKSQFIKFQMGRYYDAIDLTGMEVNILYESPTGYQDISSAVNREYSDEYIRFGWIVPYAACPVKGTLSFAVEFVGADYTLKTTKSTTEVLDSIAGSSAVPEPVEQTWYIELQSQTAATLQAASDAMEKAQQIINALATPQSAALASEMVDTSTVYVYTGSENGYSYGYWYFHDGTSWVRGGKYVSTDYLLDSTLSKSGQAADAYETGLEKVKTFVTLGAAGIAFTGNASASDPLVASVPLYYYRNLGTSGNAFTNKTGSTYTIENNQVLVYDVNTHELSVKAASAVLAVTDVVLLWKQTATIKGEWAFYYYDFINTDFEIDLGAGGISFSGNSEQNDPLSITVPLVYYRNTGSSGAGFLNKTGGTYSLTNNQALVFDITTKTLSVISVGSLFSRNYVTLIWKHVTTIKGLWAHYYYESFAVDYEVVPASNVRLSGNTTTSDPLIITTPYVYYRRYATSGTGYVNVTGGTYSLTNNQALVFDMESKTVEVLSVSTVFPRNKKMLLWKQETTIKGPWAVYFYANRSKLYLKRVMSRQGEGYDYPDNSMEAVKSALSDGYPAIRISVALTSDGVWYCTHCYEIENNATSNVLSVNGTTYTENVFINNVTSTFIDTLLYKGYAIPKLEDVLAFVSLYDVEVTLELKDDITTQGAQTLLNLIDYYWLKKVVLSGSTTQLQVFTAINTNLDIGVIFHYSAANAQSVIATFSGNYKSLRFDCWYTDTIAQSDVTDVIHPDYTIKLGGGAIGRDDLLTYVPWADVCEYAGVYSAL